MPEHWDHKGCLQPGQAREPCPLQTPDPCRVRKEIQGKFGTETPGWTRTLSDCPPMETQMEGHSTQNLCGVSGLLCIPPMEWVYGRGGSREPLPQAHRRHLLGGCLHGEGALPAQSLIMLPSWEETFSFAVC